MKRLKKIAILILMIISIGLFARVYTLGGTNCRDQGCSTGFYPCAFITYPDGTTVLCFGPAPQPQ